MEKVKVLTQDQFDMFMKSKNKVEVFKEIVGIPKMEKYSIGDTAIKVSNAKEYDVFKNTFKHTGVYYLVASVIDENLAFAYSFYPKL